VCVGGERERERENAVYMANSELVYNIDVTGGRMPSPTERPKLVTMSRLRIDGMSLAKEEL